MALVAALALGASGGLGFAAAESLADDDAPTSTATNGPTTPTVQDVDATAEPVASVAEALSPAVVQLETGTGLGSGFVYDADAGLIMTAAHVVDGSRSVTVRLADGRSVEGEVVGTDDGSDIAVVRVDTDGLTAATLALDDPVAVGQLAVAIGSPFGLDQTVTSGVVSAVGRSVETPGGAVPMIQTDAPINPGNSGGALADRNGRVIGVNDSIASESGGNVGVGFAIPIETAKAVADRLVEGLPITNGYLGVSAADATGERSGAQVVEVETGSPGGEAGIEPGDVITSLDGDPIASAADLVAAVRSREPGTEVTVGVERQGDEVEVALTLGEAPTG
ncbi:PDZ domain-containing protein [Iamia sp. SCSIO 61187]|uniref:S1C family serine protease n=1 Tax=Iamia sp. SCSIO 61187 TaxID=2722752 RepID=UPI001C633219|nr:trypsin-like peptidase domain-containing protein [Iamia sp. SCSIO 61187]QYG92630.1 PDZ domain-containing protein [Iamia sp. SCSIO 61187]